MLRQSLRRSRTHVPDRQRNQHPPQVRLLCSLQLLQQRLTGFIQLPGLRRIRTGLFQILCAQVEQLRLVDQHTGMDQIVSALFAQSVDIKRLAGSQIRQAGMQLARAVLSVGATPVGVTNLRRSQTGAALGAERREQERPLRARALVLDRAQNLRDDLAGLADGDRIAQHHALAVGLRRVVQRGHRDRRARDVLWRHDGIRRGATRAANADADVVQRGHRLFRRVLIRDRPARGAAGVAHLQLLFQGIDLDDQPVHLVRRVVPVLTPVLDLLLDFLGGVNLLSVRTDWQSPRGNRAVRIVLGCGGEALARADTVANQLHWALGRVGGILLPHRARGGIARVGEHLQPLGLALGVHGGEVLDVDEHLAADFHQSRYGEFVRAVEGIRDVVEGPRVVGDVLARRTVAAGKRELQLAVDVEEVY